ncbi:MAG: helicase-related protein [Microthrixaceae bacterium]|nr:helicase-related protein [Microthrixaceae bacterium]
MFTSATVGQPAALASAISGVDVEAVTESGAPMGKRTTVLWNPFFNSGTVGPDSPDANTTSRLGFDAASLSHETAVVATETVLAGLRTLVFCRSRRASELVANTIRETLSRRGRPDGARRVRTYRAGYLAEERRCIELGLADGSLDCVVATSALELGIDVAGLDAVVLSGFRAPWPRFANSADDPAVEHGPPWRCWSPARTNSTSGWCATPARCSSDNPNPR